MNRTFAILLLTLCLTALSCGSERPAPAVVEAPAAITASETNDEVFYGRFVEPCGRSLLEVSRSPEGPFQVVQPKGEEQPTRRLRYHVLLEAGFLLKGRLTGERVDDGHCGGYPVLQVSGFEPWGPVERVFSPGSLNGDLHLYTEELPTDRFVPEDFKGGPELRLLNSDRCVPAGERCAEGLVRQVDATGRALCCPFLE